MGSKKVTNQTTHQTQTAAPPAWTLPGLELASSKVIDALGQVPGSKYTGDFIALPDQNAIGGVMDAYSRAAAMANELAGYARANLPQETRYDAGSGMDLNPVISAALKPAYQQLTEQILPSIRSGGIESGAYSGNRALEVLPGQALRDWSASAQDTASRIAFEDYNAREARRLAGYQTDVSAALDRARMLPELTDNIMRLGTASGDLLAQNEALRQQTAQQVINNALARNQYEWQFPFQGLDIASTLLSRLSGGYGTTTSDGTSRTVEKTGGLGAVAQGVLGAASLAAGLGAFGPLGAVAGAGSGVLGNVAGTGGIGMMGGLAGISPGTMSQLFRPRG